MFHVKHSTVKGRGAQSGAVPTRFGLAEREVDGDWRDHVVTEERPKSILTFNQSPDVPFDRSVNTYRGCEHVMFSRAERQIPKANGNAPNPARYISPAYKVCI